MKRCVKFPYLAEEMHSLEPLDKIEFVPLAGNEQSDGRESVFDEKSENLNLEEIYEEAISRQEAEITEQCAKFRAGRKNKYRRLRANRVGRWSSANTGRFHSNGN